ncbi:Flagellar hook-associated protein flgK [Candidatus Hydrogenisulfobacillus filiaventi]|uniref:Flagellar hook-associated protein 1 n=1 Tax=Candidatus Hydrogenisulfobacillus filiaventi TaxID=2707344 RepID=A0A6F8ZDN5_9FIRM|nr:Flagellar hook-associated protein flgK [Candidatus Hydrogenisulfobacillus filiaventi]
MSFLMLNIAQRALAAQQIALEVTANNMANATTPGYHEEVANLSEAPPVGTGSFGSANQAGPLGEGVDVTSVTRFQNAFLARAVRNQLAFRGRWQTQSAVLNQIQGLFQEPSPGGLQEALNAFFNAWNQLAQDPYSGAAQMEVYEQGQSLAQTYNGLMSQLAATAANVQQTIAQRLSTLDSLAAQIATLNGQIADVQAAGGSANALQDQLGTLLNQLAEVADIQYTVNPNHTVDVYIGGQAVVTGNRLPLDPAWRPGQAPPALLTMTSSPGAAWYQTTLSFTWADGAPLTALAGGKLDGDLTALSRLEQYGQALATLGATLADATVNGSPNPDQVLASNTSSSGPVAFFQPFNGTTLAVAVSPGTISAANANAQNMAALADTFVSQYTALVGQVGVDGQTAVQTADNASAVLTQLQNSLQSAVGVDLNQESANLIQEQQSYLAAARLVQSEQATFNSLLAALG